MVHTVGGSLLGAVHLDMAGLSTERVLLCMGLVCFFLNSKIPCVEPTIEAKFTSIVQNFCWDRILRAQALYVSKWIQETCCDCMSLVN